MLACLMTKFIAEILLTIFNTISNLRHRRIGRSCRNWSNGIDILGLLGLIAELLFINGQMLTAVK